MEPRLVAAAAAQLGDSTWMAGRVLMGSGSASVRRPAPDVLIPAVEAWLQNPNGHKDAGETYSLAVVSLLAEEAAVTWGLRALVWR